MRSCVGLRQLLNSKGRSVERWKVERSVVAPCFSANPLTHIQGTTFIWSHYSHPYLSHLILCSLQFQQLTYTTEMSCAIPLHMYAKWPSWKLSLIVNVWSLPSLNIAYTSITWSYVYFIYFGSPQTSLRFIILKERIRIQVYEGNPTSVCVYKT